MELHTMQRRRELEPARFIKEPATSLQFNEQGMDQRQDTDWNRKLACESVTRVSPDREVFVVGLVKNFNARGAKRNLHSRATQRSNFIMPQNKERRLPRTHRFQ